MAKNNKMKSELSKTDVQIVVIVVIFIFSILAGVAEYMWLFSPKVEELNELETTLAGLQIRVEEAKRVPSQITYYQNEIDILEGKATSGEEGGETDELRQEIDVPTILAIVEQSATNADMKLTKIAMDGNAAYIKGGVIPGANKNEEDTPDTNASAFYRLGISMDVSAVTYDGLMQFLSNVEDAGYYLTTSSASLRTEDGTVYSGALTFYIYSFVSSDK